MRTSYRSLDAISSVNEAFITPHINFLFNETATHPIYTVSNKWYRFRKPLPLDVEPAFSSTIITTTTTTSNNNNNKNSRTGNRRRRGRPRLSIFSKITATILLILYEKPMSTREITDYVNERLGLNLSSKEVYNYLYHYWKQGIIVRDEQLNWSLSEEGKKFVEQRKQFLEKLTVKEESTSRINLDNLKNMCTNYSQSLYFLGKIRTFLDEIKEKIMEYYNLTRDEMDVIEILLEHYARTGGTYMYIDELARKMDATPSWLYHSVLKRLKSMRLIYTYPDRFGGIKVGLGVNLRQLLGMAYTSNNIIYRYTSSSGSSNNGSGLSHYRRSNRRRQHSGYRRVAPATAKRLQRRQKR